MTDRFDLEQQILDCWHVTDDLNILLEHIMESDNLDKDRISNIVLGMKELYNLKFQRCFDTFETMLQDRKIS
jgi:hypothetical protein